MGYEGKAPHIPNIANRLRWVASFTLRPHFYDTNLTEGYVNKLLRLLHGPVDQCPMDMAPHGLFMSTDIFRRKCCLHYGDGSSAQMTEVAGLCHVSVHGATLHGVISQKTVLKKDTRLPFD
jgi:hypothetical protein